MTMTWREREEDLIELGVTDPELLETARRATAPERVSAREAEVRERLDLRDPATATEAEREIDSWATGGLIAALDLFGRGGPYGAGHSHEGTGATDRPPSPGGWSPRFVEEAGVPPGLADLPGHQAMAGPVWDAAVASVAWREIHGHSDEETGDVRLAPWPLDDGRGFLTLERPTGLEPEWWAPLAPWLEALAKRAVIAEATRDERWCSSVYEPAVWSFIGTGVAQALMLLVRLERAREAIAEARRLSGELLAFAQDNRWPLCDGEVAVAIEEAWGRCGSVPWNWTERSTLRDCETALRWARACGEA